MLINVVTPVDTCMVLGGHSYFQCHCVTDGAVKLETVNCAAVGSILSVIPVTLPHNLWKYKEHCMENNKYTHDTE